MSSTDEYIFWLYHSYQTCTWPFREAETIQWLISTWPMRSIRIIDLIKLEDDLDPGYLTLPVEGNEDTCLVDYIILGLLKMKPECGLKMIDFSGFDQGITAFNTFSLI